MSTRNAEKEMMKKFGAFETYSKLIKGTLKSSKTKPKKLVVMKKELHDL